jgi:hypothetical protein
MDGWFMNKLKDWMDGWMVYGLINGLWINE